MRGIGPRGLSWMALFSSERHRAIHSGPVSFSSEIRQKSISFRQTRIVRVERSVAFANNGVTSCLYSLFVRAASYGRPSARVPWRIADRDSGPLQTKTPAPRHFSGGNSGVVRVEGRPEPDHHGQLVRRSTTPSMALMIYLYSSNVLSLLASALAALRLASAKLIFAFAVFHQEPWLSRQIFLGLAPRLSACAVAALRLNNSFCVGIFTPFAAQVASKPMSSRFGDHQSWL